MVERLIAAGCMPKVAAEIVTEAVSLGMSMAPNRDPAAERRRAWDREYRQKKRNKSGGSGGNRVELDPLAMVWSEGVGLLRQLGVAEKAARSNVGLWLKSQQPQVVLDRIREANRGRVGDPVPWITMSFGGKNGKHRNGPLAAAADDLIAQAQMRERTLDLGPEDYVATGGKPR